MGEKAVSTVVGTVYRGKHVSLRGDSLCLGNKEAFSVGEGWICAGGAASFTPSGRAEEALEEIIAG